MISLKDTREKIRGNEKDWKIFLMDFVDDFRFHRDVKALSQPWEPDGSRWDALLASTASYLCQEMDLSIPDWLESIPALAEPWFVSGMENLKAIALVESPLHFRIRKIFVLQNFLSRA